MEKKLSFSGFDLKVIAVVLMLIDHAGAFLFPEVKLLRIIGRLSFPIFAFLICEGFEKTRDPKKYAMRLFIFALIAEPFFDFARTGKLFDPFSGQNVLFTFLIGVITISTCEKQGSWIWAMIGMVFANLLQTDYREWGVLLIVLFWYQRKSRFEIVSSLACFGVGMSLFTFFDYFKAGRIGEPMAWYYILNQLASIASCFILFYYNGQRGGEKLGKNVSKYMFYVIYPLQFLVFAALSRII